MIDFTQLIELKQNPIEDFEIHEVIHFYDHDLVVHLRNNSKNIDAIKYFLYDEDNEFCYSIYFVESSTIEKYLKDELTHRQLFFSSISGLYFIERKMKKDGKYYDKKYYIVQENMLPSDCVPIDY